jgi:hypothetical protein
VTPRTSAALAIAEFTASIINIPNQIHDTSTTREDTQYPIIIVTPFLAKVKFFENYVIR